MAKNDNIMAIIIIIPHSIEKLLKQNKLINQTGCRRLFANNFYCIANQSNYFLYRMFDVRCSNYVGSRLQRTCTQEAKTALALM